MYPKLLKNEFLYLFPTSCTLTKSKSLLTFDLDMIIDSLKNCNNFKKPKTDSLFFLRIMFFNRKSAKMNPLDNGLLLQLMEKIDTLFKITIKQLKYIK